MLRGYVGGVTIVSGKRNIVKKPMRIVVDGVGSIPKSTQLINANGIGSILKR